MAKNLSAVLGKGLTPQQFMDGMEKNKDKFMEWYDAYAWTSDADQAFFDSLKSREDLRCLILAADWCGDVVRNIPVVFRALGNTGIPVEILIMEEHTDIMDQFLTMGGRAIPIVIFTDASGNVLGQWGPRPAKVQAVMTKFKEGNPDREAPEYKDQIKAVYEEMGRQYGEGTGYHAVIVSELRDLIAGF